MCLKGKIIKAIISIVLSQDKEAYMIKEVAGYGKGKKGKNLNCFFFFSKQHYVAGLSLWCILFLDNTLSITVFTLTKLVFETQAAQL